MKRVVDYLSPTGLPIYGKPEGQTALCVGEDGQNILAISSHHQRIIIPLWPVRVKASIDGSLDEEGLRRIASGLCMSIAEYLRPRAQETINAVAEFGEKEFNYVLTLVVARAPSVFLGENDDGELTLAIKTQLGIGAWELDTERTLLDIFPFERASPEDFRMRTDHLGYEMDDNFRERFAQDLEVKARASLFG